MVLRITFGKIAVCLIAFVHSIFLFDGILSTINEDKYFARDDDLEYNENVEAIFLYGLHFILIFSLIYSVFKNNTSLLSPWLIVTCPVFLYMTFLVLQGLKDMKSYLVADLLTNFYFVGFFWFCWTTIYNIFKTGDYRNSELSEKYFYFINYFKRNVKKIGVN